MTLKKLILPLVFFLLAQVSLTQSNTMYYLSGVPQAYYLNPAHQPQPNIFIGCPVFSSFYVETYNNSVNLGDMVWNDPETNEVIHPFHPDAGMEEFLAKFDDVTNFSLNLDFSPVSFGFRVKKMYFMFDVVSRLHQSSSFSSEIVDFTILGNADSTEYNFSDIGFNFTEHMEIGLNVSRKFGDMITVGIRPKILLGFATLSSQNNDITLYTANDVWQFDSHLELQLATPGLIIPTDETGTFDPSGEFVFDSTVTSVRDYRSTATGNKGFGIDIGVNVTPMKELTLSASIIDLGVIKWKNYLHTATLEGSFDFEGYEYEFEGASSEEDTAGFVDYLLDTLTSNFSVSGNSDPFTTRLTPKIFLGASYSILPSLDIGLLARFDIPESGLKSNLMLHAHWHPSTVFGLSASYSPFGGRATTFGLGISLRAGPFSFYTVGDYRVLKYTLYKYDMSSSENISYDYNIPVFLTADDRSRMNFRVGLNFVLGWNQRKKLMKDKPMYYSEDY